MEDLLRFEEGFVDGSGVAVDCDADVGGSADCVAEGLLVVVALLAVRLWKENGRRVLCDEVFCCVAGGVLLVEEEVTASPAQLAKSATRVKSSEERGEYHDREASDVPRVGSEILP